jgi:undecaprenyl-diphosphatase
VRHEAVMFNCGRGNVIKEWFNNFLNFFPFIGNRKVTQSFGILPKTRLILPIFLIGMLVIYLMHVFADPIYMEWFNVSNTDNPDSIYSKTTDLAQAHWFLVPTGIIMLFISFWQLQPKSRNMLATWHHRFMAFYFIFTAIAFSGLVALLLKNIFGRVRPNFYDGVNLWQSFPFSGRYDFISFPSGHTTTAGAIIVIVYLFAPRFTIVAISFAIWIGITRLGVGSHYPADVTAGLFLGIAFTWLYARSFARKRLLFCIDRRGKLTFRKQYGSS